VKGHSEVAAVFRSAAEGETGHAFGHLEFMEAIGDPATGEPIGPTADNLRSAVAGETHEYTDMYPGMAKTARAEGFEEIVRIVSFVVSLIRDRPFGSRRWPRPRRATRASLPRRWPS
jgi:rubrerythrin